MPARFQMKRLTDVTGISGTGIVAEGVQFSNGWVALTWLTAHTSVVFYPSIADVYAIHGHQGSTVVVWLDEPPAGTPAPAYTEH
jgi:hypothetical protein